MAANKMATNKLPKGWSVENLGFINAVKFTSPGNAGLLWTDGEWFITCDNVSMPARGIEMATSQKEARVVGIAFINSLGEDGE